VLRPEIKFCGLTRIDLALRATPSARSIARLDRAKKRSTDKGRPVSTVLGQPPLCVSTHAQGAKGGYRYRCTAKGGAEIWLFKDPMSVDGWNSRFEFNCSARTPLAFDDVWGRLGRIRETLQLRPTAARVSRIDFAVELLMPPGFGPDPARFSTHSRTKLRRDLHPRALPIQNGNEIRSIWTGRRISAVKIGQLPGREIEIFRISRPRQKRQVIQSVTQAPIKPETLRDELWRLEIRLGKKHLRDVFKFTEFRNIGIRADQLFGRATRAVRYLSDGKIGKNISRHPTHAFWRGVQRAVIDSLEKDKWL
jgi:hypothetical protein